MRADLGDWIKRRQQKGVHDQSKKAKAVIERSGMKEAELRIQWDLQKKAQLSVRRRK